MKTEVEVRDGAVAVLRAAQERVATCLAQLPGQGHPQRGQAWKDYRRARALVENLMTALEDE